MNMLEKILDNYPEDEFLKADGLDGAIIGVDETSMRLIYSVTKCLEILMDDFKDDLEPDDDLHTVAMEHFTFNVSGGYVGEKTPIWCWDDYGG